MYGFIPAISPYTAVFAKTSDLFYMLPNSNGGYICDVDTGVTDKVFEVEGSKHSEHLYSMVVRYDKYIFLSPWKAECFMRYNIEMDACEEICIEEGKQDEYYDMCVFDSNLYLIGLQTLHVYLYDDLCKTFKIVNQSYDEKRRLLYKRRCSEYSKKVYWESNSNKIFCYDIAENKWDSFIAPCDIVKEVLYTQGKFFAASDINEIYVKDIKDDRWKRIDLTINGNINCLHEWETNINIYFEKADRYVSIDKDKYGILVVVNEFFENNFKYSFSEINQSTLLIRVYKNRNGFYLEQDEYYLVYDVEEKLIKKMTIQFKEDLEQRKFASNYIEKKWNKIYELGAAFQENREIGLEDFIFWVGDRTNKDLNIGIDSSGRKIHANISESYKGEVI